MKIRRLMCILSAALILTTGAYAQESALDLYQAVEGLLENTSNVTLTGEAEFTYDGTCFKKISTRYLHADSLNHFIDVDYWTHAAEGDYSSGYSIMAESGYADAWDKYDHYYERAVSYEERSTLFSKSTMGLFLQLGEKLVELNDSVLSKYISCEKKDGISEYTVAVPAGDLPDAMELFLENGTRSLLSRYLYVYLPENSSADPYHSLFYDFTLLFQTLYEAAYGEKASDDYLERMDNQGKGTDEEWERYGTIYGKCITMIGKARQQYDDGYSLLNPDGTLEHYETYSEFARANGIVDVRFEDYGGAVSSLANQAVKEGTIDKAELADKTLYDIAEMLNIPECLEEIGRAQGAVVVYVREDGSCQLYQDEQEFDIATAESITKGIVNTTSQVTLGDIRIRVQLDAENRVTSVEGTVELIMADLNRNNHSVCMNFSGTAGNYGTTDLAEAKKAWDELHNDSGF